MKPTEFICIDCGVQVFSFTPTTVANDQHICAGCGWLRGIEDPKAREALREWMKSNDEGGSSP